MRGLIVAAVVVLAAGAASAGAEEKRNTGEQVLGGVISGLLGQPPASPDAAYSAQERDRLVSLLADGEYATSRQGEVVDAFVAGVPLTHRDHVYSAKPVSPSQTTVPRSGR